MKKIASAFERLKKVPVLVWIILVGASYVFASYYYLRYAYNETLKTMYDSLAGAGLDQAALEGINDILEALRSPGTAAAYLIFSGLVGVAVFEVILHLVFRSLYVRRHIGMGGDRVFKAAARAVYILANIVIGLYSLLYFPFPEFFVYGTGILNFIVYTAAFTFGYLIASYTVINPEFVAFAFKRLFTIYYAIYGILAALSLIMSVTGEISVPDIIADAVKAAVVAGSGVLIYYAVYKKLLEREKSYIIPPPPVDNDEIFKGFGF